MHRILKTILVMSIAGTSAFAQYFPLTGEKQVILGAINNGGFIMLRKFKTETFANRYGLGFTYSLNSNKSKSGNGIETKNTTNNVGGSFTFGKQKNFNVGERFSAYIALDASINISTNNSSIESNLIDTLAYNKGYSYIGQRKVTLVNNYKSTTLNTWLSILPAIGFNYYVSKNFSLGAECRFNVLSFNYSFSNNSTHIEGSHMQLNTSYDPNTGIATNTNDLVVEKYDDSKSKGNGFGLNGGINPQIYITASYSF